MRTRRRRWHGDRGAGDKLPELLLVKGVRDVGVVDARREERDRRLGGVGLLLAVDDEASRLGRIGDDRDVGLGRVGRNVGLGEVARRRDAALTLPIERNELALVRHAGRDVERERRVPVALVEVGAKRLDECRALLEVLRGLVRAALARVQRVKVVVMAGRPRVDVLAILRLGRELRAGRRQRYVNRPA
jgi:hypothetical protein